MANQLMGKYNNHTPVVEIFTEGSISLPCKQITKSFLENIAVRTLIFLEQKRVSITLIVTDNKNIQDINSEYRNKNHPTDVISFAYRDSPFPEPPLELEELGDIYLSFEKAEEQASQYNTTLTDEITRLIIHGIVHLAGYDHETGHKEKKEMERIENDILESIQNP